MLTEIFKALKKAEKSIGNGVRLSISTKSDDLLVFVAQWPDGRWYRGVYNIIEIESSFLDQELIIEFFANTCKQAYRVQPIV